MTTRIRSITALVLGVVTGMAVAGAAIAGLVAYRKSGVPTEAGPPPRFVNETIESGIEHVYDGEFQYFVGGGVAVFDCDGNLAPDLFLAGGANPSALYRNTSPIGGELRFVEVASSESRITAVTGAYPLDIDSDGISDLVVLRVGENVVLRGLGDCTFEPANELWDIDGGDDWTVAFSATWEGDALLPTLAFGNYVELGPDGSRDGCADHQVYRPQGDSYVAPERLSPGWCTLSILFSDWDGSGRRDLRMTNDRHYYRDGEEQLWRFEPNQPIRLYEREEGWQPMKIWGMGIASYDLTGDGRPEIYLTSQSDNKLQTLVDGTASPTYEDMAFRVGATAHRPYVGDVNSPSTAWHPQFEDVNNDGLVDLFVTKGNVEAMPDYAARDPNNLLLQTPDGRFQESAAEAGLVAFGRSRGAGVVDLNLDGLLDLVVVVRRENVALWRNVGTADSMPGGWLAVRLHQDPPNSDAIGASIEVRVGRHLQQREVTVGGGHAGGMLGWSHFGLGTMESEVRVRWPDGEFGPWMNAGRNRFLVIDRARSEPIVWQP